MTENLPKSDKNDDREGLNWARIAGLAFAIAMHVAALLVLLAPIAPPEPEAEEKDVTLVNFIRPPPPPPPPPPPSGGTLTKGVAVTGLSASQGDSLYYTLAVPSGASNLVFNMSGGSGDADLYVQFGSQPTDSSYVCRPYLNGNNETCTFASPQAGTYHVMLRGYTTFSGVSLVGNFDTGGTGGGQAFWENTANYTISDRQTVESPIAVSGRSGNAPSDLSVDVDIVHTYKGDLIVNLVAPDGSTYLLHNGSGGSANNINATYTVNASSEASNGTWKLRVYDRYNGDTGYINAWSLTF